jgi:hypothetical protein
VQWFPVFIDLSRIGTSRSLESAIKEELSTCQIPDSVLANQFEGMLKVGSFLLLLDGLDEVPEKSTSRIVQEIKDFSDRYHKNRYIIACRVGLRGTALPRFNDVVLTNFQDDQIRSFATAWFEALDLNHKARAEIFCKSVFKPGNEAVRELAQTPLLLTFLCIVFNRKGVLPLNRALLYERALAILFNEWAAEKGLQTRASRKIKPDAEIRLLRWIAANMFKEDRYFFSKDALVEAIIRFSEMSYSRQIETPTASAILDAIEVSQGILTRRSDDSYSFSHLTIQEFLAARYHADHGHAPDMVDRHWDDVRYREIFVMMAGIGHPNTLIKRMRRHVVKSRVQVPLFERIAPWISRFVVNLNSCTHFLALSLVLALLALLAHMQRRRDAYASKLINNPPNNTRKIHKIQARQWDHIHSGEKLARPDELLKASARAFQLALASDPTLRHSKPGAAKNRISSDDEFEGAELTRRILQVMIEKQQDFKFSCGTRELEKMLTQGKLLLSDISQVVAIDLQDIHLAPEEMQRVLATMYSASLLNECERAAQEAAANTWTGRITGLVTKGRSRK